MILKLINKLRGPSKPKYKIEVYRGVEKRPFKTHEVPDGLLLERLVEEHLEYNHVFHAVKKHELKRKVKIVKPCGGVLELV